MKKELTLREKVEEVIKATEFTDYRIAKEIGVRLSNVQRLRSGEIKLDNITLIKAEKYAAFYDEFIKSKNSDN